MITFTLWYESTLSTLYIISHLILAYIKSHQTSYTKPLAYIYYPRVVTEKIPLSLDWFESNSEFCCSILKSKFYNCVFYSGFKFLFDFKILNKFWYKFYNQIMINFQISQENQRSNFVDEDLYICQVVTRIKNMRVLVTVLLCLRIL